jgi:hypothetical protein
MALICPVCSTENREGANFCKSCGSTLSPAATTRQIPPPPGPGQAEREWATTAPAQLRAPTIPAPLFDTELPLPSRAPSGKTPAPPADEKTVIVPSGHLPRPLLPASLPSLSSPSTKVGKRRPKVKVPRPDTAERPLRSRGTWLWLGLLVAALLMLVAGWYGYGTRKAPAPAETEVAPPVSESVPAVPPVAPALPAPEPQAAEAPPAAAQTPQEPPAPPAAVAVPKPAPAAKPRKQAVPVPPGVPEAPAPAAAAPVAPPPPAAPAGPQSACGDRNFIANAQCMAAQCLKPEYKAHAQCEAVRRQQRIEEEKRNPTLAN